ncbi:hypothetical protein O3M35_002303 [Rhynocoris fuscipes]|uniref:peptidylprolyl isomerase n=1 Tax=Rhynocoris fuscipes TaxID=488301 RepID=A0AAW1CLE0_9HEMI
MEFPDTSQFKVSADSTLNSAKEFLQNERGDTNESVSNNKNEFITDTIKENIVNDENNLNINGNNEETSLNLDDNNDKDKFQNLNKTKEIITDEDEKFRINNSNLNDDFKTVEKKNENLNEDKTEDIKDEWMDILGSGQLKKKTLKPGIPDTRPQKSDVCLIDVKGKLEDGTIFEQQLMLEINLGDNELVQGLDFVLALMDKGEEAEVIVAARFGYGTLGLKPLVPPDATLYYHIVLNDVKQEPLISSLSINERIAIGSRKKERGNFWYTRDEHTLAIHSYRRALEYLDDTDIPDEHTEDQIKLLIEERLKTYNNLGASQMKISAYDAALISIDHVLNCQPKNVKALFRKSKILKEKGELNKSIQVIRQALQIEPDSKSLQQELSILLAALRKDNTKQRDLYKKMMGNSLQENEAADKKKKSTIYSYKWVAALSFAVALIGAVAFKYRHHTN